MDESFIFFIYNAEGAELDGLPNENASLLVDVTNLDDNWQLDLPSDRGVLLRRRGQPRRARGCPQIACGGAESPSNVHHGFPHLS